MNFEDLYEILGICFIKIMSICWIIKEFTEYGSMSCTKWKSSLTHLPQSCNPFGVYVFFHECVFMSIDLFILHRYFSPPRTPLSYSIAVNAALLSTGFPAMWKESIPVKPFVSQFGVKRRGSHTLICMETFWAFPDPKKNPANHTK